MSPRHHGGMEAIADAHVASVAALMGDRARCAKLRALIDGSERPAGELAKAAAATAVTASGLLQRGRAGIALPGTLLTSGALSTAAGRDFRLTERGLRLLEELGRDAEPVLRSRRMLARDCLDSRGCRLRDEEPPARQLISVSERWHRGDGPG